MTDILMPKLSDSMEQGTIISWFKAAGDQIEIGDELLEIETDKSTSPYAAETAGILEILAPVGTTVAVGETIARIGAAADPANAPKRETRGTSEPSSADETHSARPLPTTVGASSTLAESTTRNGRESAHVRATPLARRVAASYRVELGALSGTGPLGRITRNDVLAAAGIAIPAQERTPQPKSSNSVAADQEAPAPSVSDGRRQELSRTQQLVARRMSEAKSTIPHFQVQTEVVMDTALALREEIKALAGEGQPAPSINDLIVKAAAIALRAHPLANGSYRDGAFELHDKVNVGVAVAADDALVVPTVFDADIKSLGQIASDTRRLALAVRDGTISPRDLASGTFTVSNLGMFGMTAITPVINPPQAAILGVGALRSTLARFDGEIVDRNLVTLTLSCDHRILYGADASRFLAHIRELLETPLRLAL